MPVRRRVHRHRADSHPPQRADDAAGYRPAIRDEDLVKHQVPGASQIKTCTGVGLYALQGLFNWGQLLMAHRTSVSARSSTYLPGSEMPSSNVNFPSGVTGTFMQKL